MNDASDDDHPPSPFHPGEAELQSRVGKREHMEEYGSRAVRPFMLVQHRVFFQQLPFVIVGSVDPQGWPWASIVADFPGFLSSSDEYTLEVNTPIIKQDPLHSALTTEAPVALLGIEMHSRRRNRLNGRIKHVDDSHFAVGVDQSFGNCPKYIQRRDIYFIRAPYSAEKDQYEPDIDVENFSTFDNNLKTIISAADTFFVSSYVKAKDRPEVEGVDISHRGGRPGFIHIDDNTLTIPDYAGNSMFNTLGNFLVNPKAGIIFIDFASGDVVMLTGDVEILWEDFPAVMSEQGAGRAWHFHLHQGLILKNALPFRGNFIDYSPSL